MIIVNKFTANPRGETLWSGIQLVALAKSRRHHFYVRQLEELVPKGFASISTDAVTLNTVDGKMRFHIDHIPGCYCLHCGESIPYEYDLPAGHKNRGAQARAHVASKHPGSASPNPICPAGYKLKLYYGVTADDSVPTVNSSASAALQRMRA